MAEANTQGMNVEAVTSVDQASQKLNPDCNYQYLNSRHSLLAGKLEKVLHDMELTGRLDELGKRTESYVKARRYSGTETKQ